MKRYLLSLLFLLICLPTAYCAEEVIIPNVTTQEVQSFLLEEAKERNMFVREKSDTLLDIHVKADSDYFASLWGESAYLRLLYRFYPQNDGTRVTYEVQTVCGSQSFPLTAKRLGDYHDKRRSFAETRIISTIESLSKLRMKFDGYYLYGLILGDKDGDILTISEVLPVSPCEQAGITTSDTVTRFVRAYAHKIIEPEAYKDLTNEQLHALIEKELYVDETQNPGPFRHKRLAEYLERAIYVCPDCGLTEFRSEGDIVTCKTCGRQVRYLPDNRLEGVNRECPFPYVAWWYAFQNDYVNQLDTGAYLEKPLYRDTATISEVEPYKKKNLLEENAPVILYGNRLQLGKQTLFFDDIRVITVLGKNKVNVYHTDGIYQIKGDARFNGLKYMNIFYRYKNQQTGTGDFLGI